MWRQTKLSGRKRKKELWIKKRNCHLWKQTFDISFDITSMLLQMSFSLNASPSLLRTGSRSCNQVFLKLTSKKKEEMFVCRKGLS
jgi:hypothetical protein